MKNHINCPIMQAVADVDHAYDWTGIREGGFRFAAKDVQASGWEGDTYKWVIGTGPTPSEAYADLRRKIPTGAQRAAQLREDAAKLLAEADAINPIEFP